MPLHSDITDNDIHEPKGASTASSGTGYFSDGAGSGSWAKVGTSNINTTSIFNTNKYQLTASLTDVSTSSFTLVPIPVASTLTKATGILHGTIATDDDTITFSNSTGPATVGTMTFSYSGSAEGDIETLTPAGNNTFAAGTYLKIITDGASTNTIAMTFVLELTRTA